MIPYEVGSWNICFIEFNNSTSLKSRYKINDLEGYFITKPQSLENRVVYIGGKDNYYFKGVLARFDFFSNHENEDEIMNNLPNSVKTSVITQFYDLPDDGDNDDDDKEKDNTKKIKIK